MPGSPRDQRVSCRDGVVVGASATTAVRVSDDLDVPLVHLLSDDEVVERDPERGGEPFSIRRDRPRVVTDVEGEVQLRVPAFADAACPLGAAGEQPLVLETLESMERDLPHRAILPKQALT